jgi:hypothetical protein
VVVVRFRDAGGREADVDTPGHDLVAVAAALADVGREPLAAKLLALATGVLSSRTLSVSRGELLALLVAVDRVREQLVGLEWDQLTTLL